MPSSTLNKATKTPASQGFESSVYGPVTSWRVGSSLGVDLLLQTSTCSFNCIYCQLGDIQLKTIERKIYVPTEQFETDFKNSDWEKSDIVTLSGSGEPTLASNISEVIHFIHEYSAKPVMILTNGTTLADPAVRRDILNADVIAIKLDAATDAGLQQMNRPVAGVTLQSIVSGAQAFQQEYKAANPNGKLCLQCMVMPTNLASVEAMADVAASIGADEIQLNTPKRAYPLVWDLDSRGNHGERDIPTRTLRVITPDEAREIQEIFTAKNPNATVTSVYREG